MKTKIFFTGLLCCLPVLFSCLTATKTSTSLREPSSNENEDRILDIVIHERIDVTDQYDNDWGRCGYEFECDYEVILSNAYDSATEFSEGLAAVGIGEWWNRKWGFINTKGEQIISVQFENVGPFSEGLAQVGSIVPRGRDWGGYIDKDFDKTRRYAIEPRQTSTLLWSDGTEDAPCSQGLIRWKEENGKYGFLNKQGDWAIEPIYDRAYHFSPDEIAAVKHHGRWGFINTRGEWVIEPRHGFTPTHIDWFFPTNGVVTIPFGFYEELAPVTKNGKFGFINTRGDWIIDLTGRVRPHMAFGFTEGLAAVKSNGKYGYINKKAEWVVQPKYDLARPFSEGRAAVSTNGEKKWGFIDETGQEVIKPQYRDRWSPFSQGLTIVEKSKNKWIYINKRGDKIIKQSFFMGTNFHDGAALVQFKKDGKWSLIRLKRI